VGDLCFHLLDAAGNPQEKELSEGLCAVPLETFQHLVSIGQRVWCWRRTNSKPPRFTVRSEGETRDGGISMS
jgi:hypothetical protein